MIRPSTRIYHIPVFQPYHTLSRYGVPGISCCTARLWPRSRAASCGHALPAASAPGSRLPALPAFAARRVGRASTYQRVDRPQAGRSIRLQLTSDGKSGRHMVTASDIRKSYGGRCVFSGASFAVARGDKVGLVGPNGAGKTTILRIIAGYERVSEGEMWVSPSVRVAYFDQELASLADERTVMEEVLSAGGERQRVRLLLGCFLFSGDSVHKRVGLLSLGEKARLTLLKMLLSNANLLLLDEPTNYLDIPSRERVEEALEDYDGTFILVSHDRYLLSRVCNKIFALEGGTVRVYLGSYEDYLRVLKGNAPCMDRDMRKDSMKPAKRGGGEARRNKKAPPPRPGPLTATPQGAVVTTLLPTRSPRTSGCCWRTA